MQPSLESILTVPPNRSIDDYRVDFPYYHRVPKGYEENLEWRRAVLALSRRSETYRDEFRFACCRDLLFYINTFCWILEPRDGAVLPFITYPFQDLALGVILSCIGREDLVIEKSRDMGASWMCLTVPEWLWKFHRNQSFLLLSRKEELVDKRGDPKELFYKFEFNHQRDRQPGWITPDSRRMKMMKENVENGSLAGGESTNTFAGVADRKTMLLLDEFSKMQGQDVIARGTRDVTRSRIFNFTPQGGGNYSFDVAHNEMIAKLSLHWSVHPVKNRGLYRVDKTSEVELLDKSYWTLDRVKRFDFASEPPDNPRYDFRSPWYDWECSRAAHPSEIPIELDIHYFASASPFYDSKLIYDCITEFSQEPLHHGSLIFDSSSSEPTGFEEMDTGLLSLWMPLDEFGFPARRGRYIVGVDVATGTGASNSAAMVYDAITGEQVAELVGNRLRPDLFASEVLALCKWLTTVGGREGDMPYLIWEANGPGETFGQCVVDSMYQPFYFRTDERSLKRTVTRTPGWWTQNNKVMLHGFHLQAIRNRTITVRSEDCLRECLEYEFTVNQKCEHSGARNAAFASDSGDNHGDRVVGSALCAWMMRTESEEEEKDEQVASIWTLAGRRQLKKEGLTGQISRSNWEQDEISRDNW